MGKKTETEKKYNKGVDLVEREREASDCFGKEEKTRVVSPTEEVLREERKSDPNTGRGPKDVGDPNEESRIISGSVIEG